ncbi:ATP-grasp fold amidoligase family protein [Natronosalvus vescus]|uniref:ATP-grasp fold amidoligase family protein n=1 Tax=Natronosalvus vescus TaxID=2953881 RepID=UPI0020906971|nr:ATP-grasp fold amidoligase family protein [Natronosalvus vescus]
MSTIEDAKRLYRSGGIRSLPSGVVYYLLKEGPTANFTKRILGSTLHQKCLVYPSLGYWPQIENPQTFNEKILHRKLRTSDDRLATVEGKITAREYAADRIGDDKLPEVYHVTDNPEEIPFESFPEEYVIKPTHMAGEVIFAEKGETPDHAAIKERCKQWLNADYGYIRNQYWNADIDRQVMVEERLSDPEFDVPIDYKMYVFHGNVEYIHIDFDRFGSPSRRFFDRDWNALDFRKGELPLGPAIEKPNQFEEMIATAETLGADFDFIRVDLYNLEDQEILFGELTSCPASGMTPFHPQSYDHEFGSLW